MRVIFPTYRLFSMFVDRSWWYPLILNDFCVCLCVCVRYLASIEKCVFRLRIYSFFATIFFIYFRSRTRSLLCGLENAAQTLFIYTFHVSLSVSYSFSDMNYFSFFFHFFLGSLSSSFSMHFLLCFRANFFFFFFFRLIQKSKWLKFVNLFMPFEFMLDT